MENIISQDNEISVIKDKIETKEEKFLDFGNKAKNEEKKNDDEKYEKNPNDDFNQI